MLVLLFRIIAIAFCKIEIAAAEVEHLGSTTIGVDQEHHRNTLRHYESARAHKTTERIHNFYERQTHLDLPSLMSFASFPNLIILTTAVSQTE